MLLPQYSQNTVIWLLFGLSGSGKSHVGEVISRTWQWPLYQADDDITPAMRQALAETRPFTDAMRDEYFQQLVHQIERRRDRARPLVVTQGVYKRRHRDWLCEQLPGLIPVWVYAPEELIRQRLGERRGGVGLAGATALIKDFEPPPPSALRIDNDGDDRRIMTQFKACLRKVETRS